MKQFISFFIGAAFAGMTYGQSNAPEVCDYRLTCRVIAPSGLSIRESPSLSAQKVGVAPFDAVVSACEETYGKLQVEETRGYWRAVEYREVRGYMFDGYLEINNYRRALNRDSLASIDSNASPIAGEGSPESPLATPPPPPDPHPWYNQAQNLQILTETYNYCGSIEDINPGLLWYGIYPDSEQDPQGFFALRPVDLRIELSKRRLSESLEFDIVTEDADRSIFLLGLDRPLEIKNIQIKDHSELLRIRGRRLLPGQVFRLGKSPFELRAKGSVNSAGDCPQAENYRLSLHLRGQEREQDLTKALPANPDCPLPELYWYGDLSGDGWPELIFVLVSDKGNRFVFLQSTFMAQGAMLEEKALFNLINCTP